MAQETLYFPHDYDPFSDMKFEIFVIKHGVVGYGVFWRLVEMLHLNEDHVLQRQSYVYISVASRLSVTPEQVENIIDVCICEYGLFQADDAVFWSDRVFRNIALRKSISAQRSKAGRASAEQRKRDKEVAENSTDVEQPSTDVEQPSTKKERKKERNT
jgi:uncharacterized protein YdaU (DUF1376 family)